jgi:hypothetical protein
MEIKISQERLKYFEDFIFNSFYIDNEDLSKCFHPQMGYIKFLTPGTRRDLIAQYDKQYNYITVFDDKLYELVNRWVGSRTIYDLIKEDLIRRVFKVYTEKYKGIYKKEPKEVKFVDKDFNKV